MSIRTIDDARIACLHDTLYFTMAMFRLEHRRDFIVSEHHRLICDALNDVARGRCRKLIINMPPRYGKTELAVKNFIAYGLALNPAARFIHLSYSDDLAHDNSEEIRGTVQSDAYAQLFPYVQISQSSKSKKKWLTTAGGGVYATSTGGQITGFGAGVVDDELAEEIDGITEARTFGGAVIIDDPIKPEDALSDTRRERINQRFETTIRNRVNSRRTPIIIIMQRLHRYDLAGYLTDVEAGEWRVLSLPAILDEGTENERALWPFKMTLDELRRLREINRYVFETQYMQNPMPLEGLLYDAGRWRTYDAEPVTICHVTRCMVDTADTGADYLAAVVYTETEQGNYVRDFMLTQDAMDVTEDRLARMLVAWNVEQCDVESNNGGRGFARNVERKVRMLGNASMRFFDFPTTQNKATRLLTRSAEVQNMVLWPQDWRQRFPIVAGQLDGMMRAGTNAHDDAADCLTSSVERRNAYGWQTYDAYDAVDKSSVVKISEIQLTADGLQWWCECSVSDGTIYLLRGGCGDVPDLTNVQIECDAVQTAWARRYRETHADAWLRKPRTGAQGFVQSWAAAARRVLLPKQGAEAFTADLLAWDGQRAEGAVACLCSVCERAARL